MKRRSTGAFGNVDGQDRFVLVYDSPNGAVAATSTDAVTWSSPVVIGPTEKDPAVDVFNGDVYVLLSESVGTGSHRGIIYRSPDAGSWTEFARYASNFKGVAGPGMAMTTCGVTITEIGGGSLGAAVTERSGSTPGVACAGPTFTFSRERPVTDGNQRQFVGDPRARTAVAFLGR